MENTTDLEEKKELIVLSYSKTFDKDMAYSKVGLTLDEINLLNNDYQFQERLHLFLIEEREHIIQNLRVFMDSEDERIAFKATMDIANILYPDFFKRGGVMIPEEDTKSDSRLIEEYERLLGKKGCFKSDDKQL